MTNTEADNLIATLPKPGSLRLYRDGDQIVMAGGKTGAHAITVGPSSGDRLLAHWQGYVENNGLSLGPGYTSPQKTRPRAPKKRRSPKPSFTRVRHDRSPDAYVILLPNSTAQAGDKAFTSEKAAQKEAARLNALHPSAARHEVIPVWKRQP